MMIRLINTSCSYPMGTTTVHALRSVSLDVRQGEFLAIMGHSGSGKSTLLNILGCLHKPHTGNYLFQQTNIEELSSDELAVIRNRHIGFVFQTFHLLPRVSALKNVEIPLIYAGVSKPERIKRAKRLLDAVGLNQRTRHRPTELSGGQQQRVAIARALVTNPSILLADEPTGNLDTASEKQIMKILSELNQRGMTIIVVTHESELTDYANRIIEIQDGKIVADVTNKRKVYYPLNGH